MIDYSYTTTGINVQFYILYFIDITEALEYLNIIDNKYQQMNAKGKQLEADLALFNLKYVEPPEFILKRVRNIPTLNKLYKGDKIRLTRPNQMLSLPLNLLVLLFTKKLWVKNISTFFKQIIFSGNEDIGTSFSNCL